MLLRSRHARACLVHLSGCLSICCFACLKGPQPGRNFYPATRFHSFFALFSELPFLTTYGTKRSQHLSLKTAPNHKNMLKTHPQNTPTVKTCKKTPSGRGQTSKKPIIYYTFACFFQRPRALKMESKWEPKRSLRALKIKKITIHLILKTYHHQGHY